MTESSAAESSAHTALTSRRPSCAHSVKGEVIWISCCTGYMREMNIVRRAGTTGSTCIPAAGGPWWRQAAANVPACPSIASTHLLLVAGAHKHPFYAGIYQIGLLKHKRGELLCQGGRRGGICRPLKVISVSSTAMLHIHLLSASATHCASSRSRGWNCPAHSCGFESCTTASGS